MKKVFSLFIAFVLCAGAAYALPSDEELKQQLVEQSIAAYPGRCPCPYHTDRAGRRCGRRSAYNRAGGYAPLCYVSDVSAEALKAAKEKALQKEQSANKTKEKALSVKKAELKTAVSSEPSLENTTAFDNVTLLRVIDGDTFQVALPCEEAVFCRHMSVRVRGIDTAELRSQNPQSKKKAQEARTFTKDFLEGGKIRLSQCGRDKYFRLLCDVSVNDESLSVALLQAGLATEYDGGKKAF